MFADVRHRVRLVSRHFDISKCQKHDTLFLTQSMEHNLIKLLFHFKCLSRLFFADVCWCVSTRERHSSAAGNVSAAQSSLREFMNTGFMPLTQSVLHPQVNANVTQFVITAALSIKKSKGASCLWTFFTINPNFVFYSCSSQGRRSRDATPGGRDGSGDGGVDGGERTSGSVDPQKVKNLIFFLL